MLPTVPLFASTVLAPLELVRPALLQPPYAYTSPLNVNLKYVGLLHANQFSTSLRNRPLLSALTVSPLFSFFFPVFQAVRVPKRVDPEASLTIQPYSCSEKGSVGAMLECRVPIMMRSTSTCGRLIRTHSIVQCIRPYVTALHPRPLKEKCGGTQRYAYSLPCPCLALAPIMDTTRAHYSGPSRRLVVALDIGTTFSGAAYALLDPGEIPIIRSVTKWVFPSIPDLAEANRIQVPQRSESRVCKSSLCAVLRSQRQFLWGREWG